MESFHVKQAKIKQKCHHGSEISIFLFFQTDDCSRATRIFIEKLTADSFLDLPIYEIPTLNNGKFGKF
jgi:hypothetical protein